ncbi:MAG TPA: metal-dependent hydrolase [Polyangiaceae bacterium]|jgi:inner membrane protein
MASIGHIAVGMAFGRAYSRDPVVAKRAMVAFSVLSIWPDADAIGFVFHVPYASTFGHRGATHSLLVALALGLLAYPLAKRWDLPARRTAIFATLVAVSHGLLDTMTYGGGHGCALFWPITSARYWALFRFIPIAPIGAGLLSPYGLRVMLNELVLFSPFWAYALFFRRRAKA